MSIISIESIVSAHIAGSCFIAGIGFASMVENSEPTYKKILTSILLSVIGIEVLIVASVYFKCVKILKRFKPTKPKK